MEIKNILSKKDFTLTILFDNNKTGSCDYSIFFPNWKKSLKSCYKDLMNKKKFQSCYVDKSGDLTFKDIKHNGLPITFKASTVYTDCFEKYKKATNEKKQHNYSSTLSGTITAVDVMNNTQLNGLPFTGEWYEFLGEPEKNFYMIISAAPGHGKSTFALKFSNYLAKNFGRSIYITNEENEALIKRKLKFINDTLSPNFEISFQTPTLSSIKKLLDHRNFDFVFIDSSQATGIDAKELWDLKKQYSNKALIVISRMTKDGKTRGSQNKEYDGDITINFVAQGLAKTIKNRFWEVGKEFLLF